MRPLASVAPIVAAATLVALAAACENAAAPAGPRRSPGQAPFSAERSADVQRTNDRVDFNHIAAGCNGEAVRVQGRAHSVSAVATDGNVATVRFHFNTQDVTGADLASGAIYQFSEVYREDGSVTFWPPAIDEQFVGHFRLIGRGPLDNMLIDAIYDVSFDPTTQQPSFTVVKLDARCRG
ncbi:MAG TPA: hypothetical protein VJU87_10180 [Gemmatimonadaceae bacterium]|nr:hypothetical protein [Gemmatimonadaceae bacterium]